MKRLWVLIALLALPLISSADIEASNAYKFTICQMYVDAATQYMDLINKGNLSVGDLADLIREGAESDQSLGFEDSEFLTNLNFAALELAARYNPLNIGDSRVGYDVVRNEGMAWCLEADGDPTQIKLP